MFHGLFFMYIYTYTIHISRLLRDIGSIAVMTCMRWGANIFIGAPHRDGKFPLFGVSRLHRGSCDKRNGAAHVLRGVLDPKCEWPLRNSLIAQTKCNGKLGKISLLQRTHYTSTITLLITCFEHKTRGNKAFCWSLERSNTGWVLLLIYAYKHFCPKIALHMEMLVHCTVFIVNSDNFWF